MTETEFDFTGVFDADYLYFYEELNDDRSTAETELIERLLKLRPDTSLLDLACGHGRLGQPDRRTRIPSGRPGQHRCSSNAPVLTQHAEACR